MKKNSKRSNDKKQYVKNAERIKARKSKQYHQNPNCKKKKINQRKINRKKKQNNMTSNDRILAFKRETINGPNFVCCSCIRSLFKPGVKILGKDDISKLRTSASSKIFKETGLWEFRYNDSIILCLNCHKLIKADKFPSMNVKNGLQLDKVPENLASLKDLEQQLIAKLLIFMKIKRLPKFQMRAVIDRVISVPIESVDINKTISKLPRHPDDAHIIAVKLRRKLEYKSAHLEEFVRPWVVINALKELQESGNKYYQDVEIDEGFLENETLEENNETQSDEVEDDDSDDDTCCERDNITDNDTSDEAATETDDETDEESDDLDPIRKFQSKQDSKTCLIPTNLETQIVSNTSKQSVFKSTGESQGSIEIAPGENKIPTNRLREKDFDVRAFPKHYPSSKYGINHPRKYKLTKQMFLNQRLLNEDERFSKDSFFVFMASTLIEQEQLEKQIDISGVRGSSTTDEEGERVVKLQDVFSVFQKLKGTPKFWQTAKYELIAKVKQLGPFHLFYTFSCGEMR